MHKRRRSTDGDVIKRQPVPGNAFPVSLDGEEFTGITEGLATILFPKRDRRKNKDGTEYEVQGEVFYNPVQQFNRDLSVQAIKAFGELLLSEKLRKTEAAAAKKSKKKLSNNPKEALDSTGTGEEAPEVIFNPPVDTGDVLSARKDPPSLGPRGLSDAGNMTEGPVLPRGIRFAVLDALSATGLRALRYALEIPFITSVTANDLDQSAVDSIRRNVRYNNAKFSTGDSTVASRVQALGKIKVSLANAQHHMYSTLFPPPRQSGSDSVNVHTGKYEVIDLDPYGTAAPFLDAAVQAVSDGGMLCVTCTDSGIWASTGYSEKCFALYGGTSAKAEWCHEAGIRLILYSIATAAAKYGCSIEPLLSLSIDFYARVFVRVRKSPAEVKKLASTSMIVYNCDEGCGSWTVQTLGRARETPNKKGEGTFTKYGLARAPTAGENCADCGLTTRLAGPMWGGVLHSASFVQSILDSLPDPSDSTYRTVPRMAGMLQTALQETPLNNYPFFYVPGRLSKTMHCEAPPQAAIRGALLRLGYLVGRSHCKPNSIKTNAPHSVMWQIMKKWIEKKPIKEGSLTEGTPGFAIMTKTANPPLDIVLDEELGKEERHAGAVRYQVNPTANWGPMGRARGGKNVPDANPAIGEEDRLQKKPRVE